MEKRVRGRIAVLVILVALFSIAVVGAGVIAGTPMGEYPSENFVEENTTEVGASLADNDDNDDELEDYDPDYGIPNNEFAIFYSDTLVEMPEEGEYSEEDFEDEDVDLDDFNFDEIRSEEEIVGDTDGSAAQEYSGMADVPYYITPSLIELRGASLGDYRANQVEGINLSPRDSYVLEPWEDETVDEGVINEAYVGIIGVDGGAEPMWGSEVDALGDGDDQLSIGDEGNVISYMDFEIDRSEIPDTEVYDVVTISGGEQQIQQRETYEVRSEDGSRELTVDSDTVNVWRESEDGFTGSSLEYSAPRGDDVTLNIDGSIEVVIEEREYTRTRDRVHSTHTTRVSGTTEASGEGSTYETATIETDPNDVGEIVSTEVTGVCTTTESGTASGTIDETIEELNGDREIEINEDRSFTVSGTISGECSGEIEGRVSGGATTTIGGEITGDVSGEISGSSSETVSYSYWDHWDSFSRSDSGGWEFQDSSHERTDSVDVSDSVDGRVNDNQGVSVEQVSVEVSEDRYHNIVEVDYHGGQQFYDEGDYLLISDLEDQYLWSMMMFGEDTYVENDWKSYSYTKWDEAGEEPFPNQLGVYLFSEGDGPDITSGSSESTHNPELIGWKGDHVAGATQDLHDNTTFTSDSPVLYNTMVVRDAPDRATSLISVHGDEQEIRESDTRTIPYEDPDISIDYFEERGQVLVEVTGVDGEPLSGYDVSISVGPTVEEQRTTNQHGMVMIDVPENINHIQVDFSGDSLETVVDDDNVEVFYGSVSAHKSVGVGGLASYLLEAGLQLLIAAPLIMLYLLWRDFELGI